MEIKTSSQEKLKASSHHLRGAVAAELADPNAYVSDDTYELLKFYGSYQGYDRDTATERKKAGQDKEWEFMLRLKLPAGRISAAQYLELDRLCDTRANGTLRVTTRQTFQFHQIVKHDLAPFIAEINRAMLSTLGGCGDVSRNVLTCPAPIKDTIHATLEDAAYAVARHLAPRAESYADLFLDGEKLPYPFAAQPGDSTLAPFNAPDAIEPIYGETYMPRKFKVAIGQPEDNCMDALTNDLAFLALFNGQELAGYNVALGGGMGMKHNNPKTYARVATPVAFIQPSDMLRMAEAVTKLQRDHGDRADRQHARLKYLVQENGPQWTFETLQTYFGKPLEAPLAMPVFAVEDHMGWHEQGDGNWFLGLPVPSGRIADHASGEHTRHGLRAVLEQFGYNLILTNDQNIILCDIPPADKAEVARILKSHGLRLMEDITPLERNFFACVSLPTCGKALAEAERIRDPLVEALDGLFAAHSLSQEELAIRIAGCPNGCSRPYVGDIGLVGRTPGHYAIFIGGDFEGTRLNEKLYDKVPLEHVTTALNPLLSAFTTRRATGEKFGDFCQRESLATLKAESLATLNAHSWAA